MLILLTGCAQTKERSNFCDTVRDKIRLLPREFEPEIDGKKNLCAISRQSYRQIDDVNSEWDEQKCSEK